jgi:hypothetical protein
MKKPSSRFNPENGKPMNLADHKFHKPKNRAWKFSRPCFYLDQLKNIVVFFLAKGVLRKPFLIELTASYM